MEEWKDVFGYEGAYQVSSLGNVKSCARVIERSIGDLPLREHILKCSVGSHGYKVVNLRKDGKSKVACVHHLVAAAFIGERPKGYDVCHKDGCRTNNAKENLRYGTRAENVADAFLHKTFPLGGARAQAKLSADDVADIRKRWDASELQREIAERYNVSRPYISSIVNGHNRTNGL